MAQPPQGWGANPNYDPYADATTESDLPPTGPEPNERQGPLAIVGPDGGWTAQQAPWPGTTPTPTAPMPPAPWPGGAIAPQPYRPSPAPPLPPARPGRRTTRRMTPGRRRVVRVLALLLVLALCVGSAALAQRLYAFGSAISSQPPLSTQTGLMSGPDRINVVVLGYGGAGHDGAYLSDSMMLISLNPGDLATTLISVPRDLWVQVPPNSGQYAKLNTAFQDGVVNGYGQQGPSQLAGGLEAAQKVTDVTGLTTPYFLALNFQGFRELVDDLGGVDINVPVAFTAQYPINDDPSINAGWKTIHFNTGVQHMNGERAIEYARARYVTDPASQGSDFARSARQQLLIRAIIDRMKSPTAWPGFSNGLTALQSALYTNLSLTDLMAFTAKLDLNDAAHVQLTDQNVLTDAVSSDGQDILLPQNGNWSTVQQYVASNLKP